MDKQHASYKEIPILPDLKVKKPRKKKDVVTKKNCGGVFHKKAGNFIITFD